jgi:hypothetical protein
MQSTILVAVLSATAGASVGAFLNHMANRYSQWRQKTEQRQAAEMWVANDLRYWLSCVSSNLSDTKLAVETAGGHGRKHYKLPAFRFENSLEQVVRLDADTAKRMFELIFQKDQSNSAIACAIEHNDEYEASDAFREQSAQRFLEALGIYRDVCEQIGWSSNAFDEWEEPAMHQEIERIARIDKRRSAFNEEFFADMNAALQPS